jgi:hypothetical protein
MENLKNEYVPVRFYPCGCVSEVKHSEVVAAGVGHELADPERFGMPTLPSRMCDNCPEHRDIPA